MMTLTQLMERFSDEDTYKVCLRDMRWPNAVTRPRCHGKKVYELKFCPWHWICKNAEGIAFLVPLLIPFLVGGVVCAVGMWKAGLVSTTPTWFFCLAIIVAGVGVAVVSVIGPGRHAGALAFLGFVALGYDWIGFEFLSVKASRDTT